MRAEPNRLVDMGNRVLRPILHDEDEAETVTGLGKTRIQFKRRVQLGNAVTELAGQRMDPAQGEMGERVPAVEG